MRDTERLPVLTKTNKRSDGKTRGDQFRARTCKNTKHAAGKRGKFLGEGNSSLASATS